MTGEKLANRYAIVGAGQSRIGEVPGVSSLDLIAEAMRNAVFDAGLHKSDIDGLICRGPDDAFTFHQQVGQTLGLDVGFATTLDNGGASQIMSVALAAMAIDAGLCSTVLCGYGRDAWSRTHRSEDSRMRQAVTQRGGDNAASEFSGAPFGLFGAPAVHAFGARRHMALYGTTKEQLGAVAVSFRQHARRNPTAQMHHRALTLEDYLAGREIIEPFNLFDCSLRTDAAGAVVVTSAERAKDLARPPALIAGFGTQANLRGWYAGDHMLATAAEKSAEKAYAMAGIGPEDVDAFEVYDCFTYMVIAQLEAYGFCKRGEGGPFAESGALALGGALPTNTAGGQLSEGHAEGMLQIVEAVRQVRHDYGPDRQVDGAEVVVASGHGGSAVCHSTLVLTRA